MDVDEEPGGSAPSAPATKLQDMRRRNDPIVYASPDEVRGLENSSSTKLPIFVGPEQKNIRLLLKI